MNAVMNRDPFTEMQLDRLRKQFHRAEFFRQEFYPRFLSVYYKPATHTDLLRRYS